MRVGGLSEGAEWDRDDVTWLWVIDFEGNWGSG